MTPTPRQDPQLWNVAIGTDVISEAIVRSHLIGLETSSSWDKAKANGRNGATLRYQGDELATWSIRLSAANAEGLEALLAICRYVRKASPEKGIAVAHPMLVEAGVSAMVVEKIKWPDCSDADTYVAELQCIQWAPAPKSTKSVTKKISDADLPGDLLSTSKAPRPKPTPPKKPWEQPAKP